MTTSEFNKKLDEKIKAILTYNKPLLIAVKGIMAVQSKRIFLDGKNADGGLIGNYKNSPLYASKNVYDKTPLKKFQLRGKYGETKFKDGKLHKSGYFETFLHFKKAVGRNKRINSVDLFLTGELHRHWANSDVVGKADAKKINQHRYVVSISETDVKKVSRYNRVFNLSAGEKALFLKSITNELIKALK